MNPPVFLSAVYDGSSVLVNWRAGDNPGIAITGYTATVASSAGPSWPKTVTAFELAVSIPTGALATAGVTYTVQVCAQASGQSPACTQQFLLITVQPALAHANYDGSSVELQWTPLPAGAQITSYTASLFPAGGGFSQTVTVEGPSASSTTIRLAQPLSGAYSVQITAKNMFGVGAATAPTAINTTTPSLLAATYSGGTSIIMSWAAPQQPAVAVSGYVLRAVSTDGGAPFTSTISSGALTNGSIAIPYPLDPSKTYSVFVTATTATPASSSCAPAAINTVQPRLTSVLWNGTSLSATWQPIAYPSTPVAAYQMIAFSAEGGSPITSTIPGAWAANGSMANPSFASDLAYQLEISAQSANGIGTYSNPVPIFATRPAITGVTYDGAAVSVTWTPAPNAPAADSYQVTISSSAGSYSTGAGGSARTAAILLPSPLDLAVPWSATVVASAGIANATSAAVPLQLTQASITIATYDGATLAVSWSIAQQPTQSYIRVVSSNGYGSYSSDAIQAPLTNGTIAFGSPLGPAGAYTLFIEAQYPNGITTRSTAEPLVAVLPIVLSATYDGNNVAVQWIPVTGSQPQLGGYQLKSYSNEGGSTSIAPIANASAAAGVVAGPPNALLPSIVQVCGIARNVQSCSAQLALVQSSATVATVTYDGANVRATWIPGTSATAWIASIEQGGSAVASVTVTGTTAAIPAKLDLVHAYTLSVRAMAASIANGVARTSIGPAVTNAIISAAPAITNVVTNSSSVVVTIDTSGSAGGAGVQGYQASLWQGETNVATGTASGSGVTSVTIPYTLQPQFAYRVAVQAIGSSAASLAGPSTERVPVVAARPSITMTSISGTSATIAWTPATDPAVTGYSAVITQAGIAGSPIVTTSPQLTATIDPAKATTVSVTAIGSSATGLAGVPATLVTETLTPSTAAYDGTLLTMTWPAASTSGATYIAEVLSGGGVVARVAQSGTCASVPIALDGTATVRVTVVAGNATGAPGSPLAVIATVPDVVRTSATGTNVTATIDTTTTGGLPGVSGWEAALYRNGNLVAGPVAATGSGDQVTAQIPTSGVSGSGFTIRARAVGATSASRSGPYGNPVSAILSGASVEHIAYDGASFLVTWNAVSDPAARAYRVTVGSAEVDVSGSATTIPIQLAADTSYAVGITPMGANATGPPALMTFLVPAQVALLTASYDGANVGATWAAVGAGVSGYRMELYVDSALVATTLVTGGASTAGTLHATLPPGARATIAVTAMNGSVAGPRSTTLPLIGSAPSLIDVFYDGTSVNAAWTAVPGAAQYELAVYQGSAKVTSQMFTGTSAALPVALSGSGYQVMVRATATSTAGAWSAGVNPQSGPAAFFLSSDSGKVPYLYRSTYRPPLPSALTSSAVTLYFPDLFTCNPPSGPPAEAFALQPVEHGGQIRWSITVASSVWTFDRTTNIRPALRSQFLAFIEWLEPALKPGAAPFIARALSAGMPLSFAESLLYRYGFNPVSGYVDLVPGMKLRLDAEVYQLIPSSSPASLNGFVPSGSTTYDVTAATVTDAGKGTINVAFDAFLSLLPTLVPVAQGGGGGVIDLYQPGFVKPYYRLFYPVSFPSAGVQGYSDASRNVALVGASSIAALEAATQTYLTQKNWNGIPSSDVSVAYFRGRMVALPRIVVVVDGVAQDVSVGTTLRQLIGSWANLPFSESLQVASIAMERPTAGVVDAIAQAATTLDVAQTNPIRFATQPVVTYPDGEDWFDLPLFGADRISLGGS